MDTIIRISAKYDLGYAIGNDSSLWSHHSANTSFKSLTNRKWFNVTFYGSTESAFTAVGTRRYFGLAKAERAMYLWCLLHKGESNK